MTTGDLLRPTDLGLYCERGGFFVDPWRPVPRAVVTHAHADHACAGCGRYLTSAEGARVLRVRVGRDATVDALPYGDTATVQGVRISLHPAGHILGSSQVRLEYQGEVWVVSGDYKVAPDTTCTPFEPVACHVFVTESTFGLPIYRWPAQQVVFEEINAWWRTNRDAGKASLLLGYALGKAQRLLAGLDPAIGPIFCHGAVEKLNQAYREEGVRLPPTAYTGAGVGVGLGLGLEARAGAVSGAKGGIATASRAERWAGAMIVAPPSAQGTPWARKFTPASTAVASGWMTIRGTRRRKAVDRGFVLSDHADWSGLLETIRATGARRILVTHGYTAVVVRYLREQGIEAEVLPTRYEGEGDAQDRAEGEALQLQAESRGEEFP